MKHFLNSIVLALMAILVPALAQAHDFAVNGIYYNITSDNEVEVTYKGTFWYPSAYQGVIAIPSSVSYDGKTYKVTSIGPEAFIMSDYLSSVSLPNSVTRIGEEAFFACEGLRSVTFGNGLADIGPYAFYRCTSLTSVTLPGSLISIGQDAFVGCTGMTRVSLPSSVTTIGDLAFAECGLTSVTIPGSVTSIGENPFALCSALKTITVASGNTTYNSHEGCNAIIETSTNKLISGCQNTTILSSVTAIGESAFAGCTGLTSFSLPGTVTTIGAYAYEGCTSLTSVTIPGSVTSIGKNPFAYCSELTSIQIENGNPNFDSREGCNAIIAKADNKLVSGCMNTTIPSSVTSLGEESFAGCTGLTAIDIPSTVTGIEWGAFLSSGLKSLDIPGTIDVIADFLCYDCSRLASVTLPKTVTRIGESAFEYSGLRSIEIPATVTYIGYDAFYYCSSLANVYTYIKNPKKVEMPDNVFENFYSYNYSRRTLHVPAGTTAAYQADKRWSDYFGHIEEMPGEVPGDVNCDGSVNISDVNEVIDAILSGAEFDSAFDVNGDGTVNISDINTIIAIILK